jgi:hypothetical protein
LELLEEICERDCCLIELDNYKQTTRDSIITFICGQEDCDNIGEKTFNCLFNSHGYCRECTQKIRIQKQRDTCLKRYGSISYTTSEISKNINMEKFGVEYNIVSKESKEKILETIKNKYGEDIISPLKVPAVREKLKATCKERYGAEFVMQQQEFKDKKTATCLEKYGVENPSQLDEIKEKKKATIKKNFGVTNPVYLKKKKEKN